MNGSKLPPENFSSLREASFYSSRLLENSRFDSWNAHETSLAWLVTVIHTKRSPAFSPLPRPGGQDPCLAVHTRMDIPTYEWIDSSALCILTPVCVNRQLQIPRVNCKYTQLNANRHICAPQIHTCVPNGPRTAGWTRGPHPRVPTSASKTAQTYLPDLWAEVWLESIEGGRKSDKPARTEPALLAFQEGRR